jgi:hypothetical protein
MIFNKSPFTIVLILVGAFTLPISVFAAEESDSVADDNLRILDITHTASEPKVEDIDDILTNKKMRAESGSKSKYSISTALGYSGSSIQKPLASVRPNIANATGYTPATSLDGSVSGKYVIDTKKSILAGVGFRMIAPLAGAALPAGYQGNKYDVSNPYGIYQYVYKWAGIQSVAQIQGTFFTTSDLTRNGYVASLGLAQNNAYEIGTTGATIGIFAYTGAGFYNKNGFTYLQKQSDYSFGFSPFLEYQINHRLNLRTAASLVVEHLRSQPHGDTYQSDKVNQTLGLGISVMRDFYLFPNIVFLPDNIRADQTTVALNANLNVF